MMKEFYNTPELTVEELLKQDVLCNSPNTPDTQNPNVDNFTLGKSVFQDMQDFFGSTE